MSIFKKIIQSLKPEKKEKVFFEKPQRKRGRPPKTKEDKWFETEGKLSIDLYKSGGYLVINSAIAGVKPEELEITIQGDVITISGTRIKPQEDQETEKNYFIQECYWGPFSRQIILPEEVDPSRAQAQLKEGILIIKVPALEKERKRKIVVSE
jgi:HSP20 family protein